MSMLTNAARVLRCFSSETPELTVTDVAQRLGLPKASASRLMKTMREAGFLETIGATRRHRPGRLLLDMAAAFRGSSVLIARAGEVVARVSAACGHTGYVSVLDGREVTAVQDFPGTNALRVVSNIGRRLAAHASSTGRALLARLPEAEVAALHDGHLSPADLALLRDRLARIRAEGYALSHQEATPGVDAIGIAVADPATAEAVALCIVYPAAVVSPAERDAIVAALADGAADIARLTGDTGFRLPELAKGTAA